MEFGSKYVYCYNSSDEECVSDDEYCAGITDERNPLDAETPEDSDVPRRPSPPDLAAGSSRGKGKKKLPSWSKPVSEPSEGAARGGEQQKWRQADTNVVAVKFDQLTKPSNMHTGDAVCCKRCHAVLSHISTIPDATAEEKIWQCEFCDERNVVDISSDEIPSEPDVTYMISPAPATTAASCQGDEGSMVIFCIDVSGSMSGRLHYITAAVISQLKQLRDEHPTRKVALVTFDSEVLIFGDGTSAAKSITGSTLHNYDELTKIGIEAAVPRDVKSSFDFLHDKIKQLRAGSMTALGPALLMSVFMASKVVGSKVVLCTDGCANVGLGHLDSSDNSAASEFYLRLGETASSKAVVVSVLTVADTDCRLIEIGNVAQATGGHVNIVDPRKLADELGEIFVSSLIAVGVSATFVVHSGLYIRGEMEMTSSITRKIGNVTKDMDITFEYGVRPHASWGKKASGEEAAASSSTEDTPSELPFQLQVTYTDLDGAKAMRVLTQVQPVTRDRSEAETHINVPVVTCHASKQTSEMAMKGHFKPSRLNALMHQRLVARNTRGDADTYRIFSDQMRPLEQRVLRKQQLEAAACGSTIPAYEDSEKDDDAYMPSGLGSKMAALYKKKMGKYSATTRRMQYTDPEANQMYEGCRANVDKLKK